MILILSFLFAGFIGLASIAVFFYVLYLLYKEKGLGHGLLGFLFPIYPYIWGWMNGKKLQILDIMGFWTALIVLSIFLPVVMTPVLAASGSGSSNSESVTFDESINFSSEPMQALGSEDAIPMGSVPVGGRVDARIDDLFEVHNWTFSGNTGQAITVQGNALPGESTDPRVNLLGPDGSLLTGDDDGGENNNAFIPAYTLPADGQYILQVDVWQTGGYELILN